MDFEKIEITEEQFAGFEPNDYGAFPSCRVCEHPDLQEWSEFGVMKTDRWRCVRINWLFDHEPTEADFIFANLSSACIEVDDED